MDMSASYKPVMLLALLDSIDDSGKARLSDVVRVFRPVLKPGRRPEKSSSARRARMARVGELEDAEVQRVLLEMPFEKFGAVNISNTTRPGVRPLRPGVVAVSGTG
jgi:hypothetical protein